MADSLPQFETEDRQGSLDVYSGTVGTSWVAIPTVSGTLIQEFMVLNPDTNSFDVTLDISIDSGTTIHSTIFPNGFVSQEIKGNKNQIWIKGSVASTFYKVILEREVASV